MTNLRLLGASLSPFVRKVRIVLAEKGLPYELKQVSPFDPPADFLEISPLGKIPVLEDGDYTLADSSAICSYLEARYPTTRLYPKDPKSLGRALWIEELLDTDAGLAAGWIFRCEVVMPLFLHQNPPDDELAEFERSVKETLPYWFTYLEAQVGQLGESFDIADAALASNLVALSHCNEAPSLDSWPTLKSYRDQVIERPSVKALLLEEQRAIRLARQRRGVTRP